MCKPPSCNGGAVVSVVVLIDDQHNIRTVFPPPPSLPPCVAYLFSHFLSFRMNSIPSGNRLDVMLETFEQARLWNGLRTVLTDASFSAA